MFFEELRAIRATSNFSKNHGCKLRNVGCTTCSSHFFIMKKNRSRGPFPEPGKQPRTHGYGQADYKHHSAWQNHDSQYEKTDPRASHLVRGSRSGRAGESSGGMDPDHVARDASRHPARCEQAIGPYLPRVVGWEQWPR